jgi:hypothetical protein
MDVINLQTEPSIAATLQLGYVRGRNYFEQNPAAFWGVYICFLSSRQSTELVQVSIPSITLRLTPRLGDWESVRALGEHLELVAALIVNHISSDSPQFKDFSERRFMMSTA